MESIEYSIAKLVDEIGGKTYYVGGYVRDLLMSKSNTDIDIEVHGIKENQLLEILKKFGRPLSYGKSFGIYSIEGYHIDIALPRSEIKTGTGHTDFNVTIDPYIDINQAIARRDFTINAIYRNVLTGELIDPYGGIDDLNNKLIKHIKDDTFVEDPLRVLRGCQFASRFGFDIDKKTIELCKKIEINNLSSERVLEELKKALLLSTKPSMFFKLLDTMNKLGYWFKDVDYSLIDKANKYINNVNHKFEYLVSSLSINNSFDITKLTNETSVVNYVHNMKDNINKIVNNDYEIYKLFNDLIDINDYIYLRMSMDSNEEYLLSKYDNYKELMSKEYVTGKDLVELGFKPGVNFNEILKYCNELRLQGISKSETIKQVLNRYSKN